MTRGEARIGIAGPLADAVRQAEAGPPATKAHLALEIRCQACRHALARVARTPYGLLFLGPFREPKSPWRQLGERFDQPQPPEWYGVRDLLDFPIPPGCPGHPDLFVRCARPEHGDAVLQRDAVLWAIASDWKTLSVPLSGVRLPYTVEHN